MSPRAARAGAPAIRLLVLPLALAACGHAPRANLGTDGRLRFVSSQATQASWSFRVDDRARGAELLVDGRPRDVGCDRAGRELRCELRGLWPGGHLVELRLPGALLRRSVLVGKPWPERPLLVRARGADEAAQAAEAGADGVILDGKRDPADLSDLIDAVHAKGARAIVAGEPWAIELAGADALLSVAVPAELGARFPEARALALDDTASRALAAGDTAALARAGGLVDARGTVEAALALLAPKGAIVDRAAFPLLQARKRHAALRAGTPRLLLDESGRVGFTLTEARDEVIVLANSSAAPWPYKPPSLALPLDLLGGPVREGEATVAAHDAALLIATPARDQTRY